MPKKSNKVAKLALAQRHMKRVEASWDDPVDWDDLSLYGFYCLEAAVEAAALHFKIKTSTVHAQKVEVAQMLHHDKGLPDVSELLVDLNGARKAAAYGDVDAPELDPEEVKSEIAAYVEAVEKLLA
jgi:hypothetical protein